MLSARSDWVRNSHVMNLLGTLAAMVTSDKTVALIASYRGCIYLGDQLLGAQTRDKICRIFYFIFLFLNLYFTTLSIAQVADMTINEQ